jgi:ribonuclease T2
MTPDAIAATHLTLHGLWPNYSDEEATRFHAEYPQFCGKFASCKGKHEPAFCEPDPASLPAAMTTLGPGFVRDHHFLANHEWPKHGSCTGLAPAEYFSAALRAMEAVPGDRGTPDLVKRHQGGEVPTAELAEAFGPRGSVLLSCNASCRLEQVSICLAREPDGRPGKPVACPASTDREAYDNGCVTRHCAEVHIPAFGACGAEPSAEGHAPKAKKSTAACNHPGQGPACEDDAACTAKGYARCAKSGCCTNVPK